MGWKIKLSFSDIGKAITNVAKEIEKGAKVNAANITHGMQVNAQNIKHGMEVNAANAKKFVLKYFPLTVLGRNATLALIKANAFGLARACYLAAKNKKSPQWAKLALFWKDIGGDPDKLMLAIKMGMDVAYRNHKSEFSSKPTFEGFSDYGYNNFGDYYGEYLAFEFDSGEPVSTAAAVVAAAPVIAKLIDLLQKMGMKKEDAQKIGDALQKDLEKGSSQLLDEALKSGEISYKDFTQEADGSIGINMGNLKKLKPKINGVLGNELKDDQLIRGIDNKALIALVVAAVIVIVIVFMQKQKN